MGIPEEDQDKLFKLFEFLNDHKEMNTKGVGLGLVIMDQITSEFCGTITFKSKPTQGSTFSFTFNLSDEFELNNAIVKNGENDDEQYFLVNHHSFYNEWSVDGVEGHVLEFLEENNEPSGSILVTETVRQSQISWDSNMDKSPDGRLESHNNSSEAFINESSSEL